MRRIAARAFDDSGVMVAEDGSSSTADRTASRSIVEPEVPRPGERMIAKARVDLPEGEQLDRLEFFVDDVRLATLYQPPFTVALAAGPGRVSTSAPWPTSPTARPPRASVCSPAATPAAPSTSTSSSSTRRWSTAAAAR
ncbi:MAG: hypothetical protein R2862_09080 [Thermoanaerobaculia bacterium]